MNDDTRAEIERNLPPTTHHPESRIMKWSALEIKAIAEFAVDAILADRERRAEPSDQPALATFKGLFARAAEQVADAVDAKALQALSDAIQLFPSASNEKEQTR